MSPIAFRIACQLIYQYGARDAASKVAKVDGELWALVGEYLVASRSF